MIERWTPARSAWVVPFVRAHHQGAISCALASLLSTVVILSERHSGDADPGTLLQLILVANAFLGTALLGLGAISPLLSTGVWVHYRRACPATGPLGRPMFARFGLACAGVAVPYIALWLGDSLAQPGASIVCLGAATALSLGCSATFGAWLGERRATWALIVALLLDQGVARAPGWLRVASADFHLRNIGAMSARTPFAELTPVVPQLASGAYLLLLCGLLLALLQVRARSWRIDASA